MRMVIGIGNELHGDDGFAAAVCRRLCALPLREDVQVVDAGTRGLDALALLAQCSHAVLIDAHAPQQDHPCPGRVREVDVKDLIFPADLSGHAGGVPWLIQAMRATLDPVPSIRLLTAEAAPLRSFHIGLSPAVAAAVEQVVGLLAPQISAEVTRE